MEENNTKEVNLLQLINLFFNWLKNVGKKLIKSVGYIFQLSFRHKLIVILTILICLSIGLYLSRPSVRVYKAEAMAMLYGSEAQTAKEVSKQLENSVASNNFYSLAAKLFLPDSITKNIVGIQSFYVIANFKDGVGDMIDYKNNHPLTDTLNVRMKDRFYLQIKTTNVNQIPKVQAAILSFFNNNTVMKSQYEIKKDQIINQIKICNVESQLIDSLARVSYFKNVDKQLRFDKDNLVIGEQKKQLFYDDLLRLHDTKSYAQNRLVNFTHPMELPSGFYVYSNAENGKLKYGIISILIGFILSLIFSGLVENTKKIIAFLNKK